MGKERAGFKLDADEQTDIEDFTGKGIDKPKIDPQAIREVSEASGFPSRQPQKPRRKRKKSPYNDQLGVKVRTGIKGLFQDLGERMEVYDHTTFEKAILALIEKQGYDDLKSEYEQLVKGINNER